jgi:hypothetical protein
MSPSDKPGRKIHTKRNSIFLMLFLFVWSPQPGSNYDLILTMNALGPA